MDSYYNSINGMESIREHILREIILFGCMSVVIIFLIVIIYFCQKHKFEGRNCFEFIIMLIFVTIFLTLCNFYIIPLVVFAKQGTLWNCGHKI